MVPVLSANIIIGHEVVRLPVAHCELNPIEMAQVKRHVSRTTRGTVYQHWNLFIGLL